MSISPPTARDRSGTMRSLSDVEGQRVDLDRTPPALARSVQRTNRRRGSRSLATTRSTLVRVALAGALAVTLASCTVEYPVPTPPTATSSTPTAADTGVGDVQPPDPSATPTGGDAPTGDAPTDGAPTTDTPTEPTFWYVRLPPGYAAAAGETSAGWRLRARSANGCEALDRGTLAVPGQGDLREATEALLHDFVTTDRALPGPIDEIGLWTGPEAEGGEQVPFLVTTWTVPAGTTVRTAARVFEIMDFWTGQSFESLAFQLRCPAGSFDEVAWQSFTSSLRPNSTIARPDPWGRDDLSGSGD